MMFKDLHLALLACTMYVHKHIEGIHCEKDAIDSVFLCFGCLINAEAHIYNSIQGPGGFVPGTGVEPDGTSRRGGWGAGGEGSGGNQ